MNILGKNIHNKMEKKLPLNKLFILFVIISVITFAIDQGTKYLIFIHFDSLKIVKILPFFNLRLVYNKGISFSAFSNGGSITHTLLIILPLAISAVLFIWMIKDKTMIHTISTSLIVGGAMGNLIDRFHYIGVIDFLDFHISTTHYPTFNGADSFVFIGAVLIFIRQYI